MNHKVSPEAGDRTMALLALRATDTPQATDCPSEETLAQFLGGQLGAEAREATLAHLNRCPSCYYHWLEVGAYLNAAVETAPTPPHTESRVSVWRRLQPWIGDWRIAAPVAATAAVVLAVGLWWPRSPDLNAELDLAYTRLSAKHTAPVHAFPALPWEGAALGFGESQASVPTRAFGAGLWAGRRALSGADEQTLPEFLSPPGGVPWVKTAWADYHALGRWMILAWTLTSPDPVKGDWRELSALAERLLGELSKGATEKDEDTRRATATLQRLEPLIEIAVDKPRSRAALRRAVEIAMQQLAP